jgi:hypothetical protein
MLSIVSFSTAMPIPNELIVAHKQVTQNIHDYERTWGEDIKRILKMYKILDTMMQVMENQTETLNSFISPPPPPPPPSPPPSRCYHWQELFGEGKTQKLLCKLGI